jgi:hypothetical protein
VITPLSHEFDQTISNRLRSRIGCNDKSLSAKLCWSGSEGVEGDFGGPAAGPHATALISETLRNVPDDDLRQRVVVRRQLRAIRNLIEGERLARRG